VAVPSAISVNMFSRRERIDSQPRTKKGQPPQSTTGVPSASWIQLRAAGGKRSASGTACSMASIAMAKTGAVSSALTARRRLMSSSSGLPSAAAPDAGSSAIPQIGHVPGASRLISGCIGQV
jgi:hypothetical protein